MVLLLISCVVFHAHFAGPAGVLPIVFLAIVTYFAGRSKKPRYCELAIALCVLALVFYKYTKFICESLIGLAYQPAGIESWNCMKEILPGMPPLAISFFAFEFVHYLYEIRRGGEPIKSPIEFSVFAVFWPSIVSGPIKRYQQFIPSLKDAIKNVGQTDVAVGVLRVAWGLAQKLVADNLSIYISGVSTGLELQDTTGRWYFLACLAARIYFDFAGYSDIAIGYARMMGIKLPENFNCPYLAHNMVDFWQRWHISLSTWIRDYIYIPLGGGTHGPILRARNAFIAFVLCGLWHGAAWNFALWGIYHGLGVVVASNYQNWPGGKSFSQALSTHRNWNRVWSFCSWLITLLYVWFGWLLFFYPVETAWKFAKLMFVPKGF